MRILIAPSGFKESLAAEEVAECIEQGVLKALPDAIILKSPIVDGGEGFTKRLVEATGGTLYRVTVTGPVGGSVCAHYGFLGTSPKTAILEMAAASGLRLVPQKERNPLMTTTYGVGELIRAALDRGAERIIIGCGDSGTNDGGAGMAQALGVRLYGPKGRELGWGGGELVKLEHIDMSGFDERLESLPVIAACNIHNVLCGPNGVAQVFGPQKGAKPEMVEILAAGLERYAKLIQRELGIDVRTIPGGGASGGLGAGLHVFCKAKLNGWADVVFGYLNFDQLLQEADLVFTGEGSIDFQTTRGKIPAEIARRAKRYHLPVIALAGTIGKHAEVNYSHCIDSFFSILEEPCTLTKAISQAPELISRTAERMMRLVLVGRTLQSMQPA